MNVRQTNEATRGIVDVLTRQCQIIKDYIGAGVNTVALAQDSGCSSLPKVALLPVLPTASVPARRMTEFTSSDLAGSYGITAAGLQGARARSHRISEVSQPNQQESVFGELSRGLTWIFCRFLTTRRSMVKRVMSS